MADDVDGAHHAHPWLAYDNLGDWCGVRWTWPSWFRDEGRPRLFKFGDFLQGVVLSVSRARAKGRDLDRTDGEDALSLVFGDDFESQYFPFELISERGAVSFFKTRAWHAESFLNRRRRPAPLPPDNDREQGVEGDLFDEHLADYYAPLQALAAAGQVPGKDGDVLRLYLWLLFAESNEPTYERLRQLDASLRDMPHGTLASHIRRGRRRMQCIYNEHPPEIDPQRAYGRIASVATYAHELLFNSATGGDQT